MGRLEGEKDLVEVIRCGDCKYWRRQFSMAFNKNYHHCDQLQVFTTCDDYCSRAKRREQ